MPWSARDAYRHTKKASTPKLQRQWAHVANSALQRGLDDSAAIREANAVVSRGNSGPNVDRKKSGGTKKTPGHYPK